MNDVKTLTAQVAEIVGQSGVAPAESLADFAVDGRVPAVVALPDNVEQMARLVTLASEAGLGVVPWGGGTAMGQGAIPRRVDLVISTQRLKRILDYSPEDLTITAQAGVTLSQLAAAMAGHGQMLPLDPPLPEQATVGGVLATNASGPLRYQFGMPRDLVLGTVVVYADGTVAKSGGRTVKNVAGYDMSRLHIGAMGTLGIIAEATFKVLPVPKSMITVAGRFPTLAAAAVGARALRMARIVAWSLVLIPSVSLPGTSECTVAVRLGGPPAVIEPQAQRALDTIKEAQGAASVIEKAEESLWPTVRDWPATVGDASSVLVRMSVAPSHMGDVLASALDIAGRHGLAAAALAHPGAATVYCHLPEASDQAIAAVAGMLAVVKEWNGHLVVERCPNALKERMAVWGGAVADALTQRIKHTFDPKGILNPGRFVGAL